MSRPILRFDRPREAAAIRALLDDAFGGATEGAVVEGLAADGALMFTIVAEAVPPDGPYDATSGAPSTEGAIIGVCVVSDLAIELDAEGAAPAAAMLGPVAVAAAHRGRGIGVSLVRAALAQLRRRGVALACAEGPPSFLDAAGFSTETTAALRIGAADRRWRGIWLRDDPPKLVGAARRAAAFDRAEAPTPESEPDAPVRAGERPATRRASKRGAKKAAANRGEAT